MSRDLAGAEQLQLGSPEVRCGVAVAVAPAQDDEKDERVQQQGVHKNENAGIPATGVSLHFQPATRFLGVRTKEPALNRAPHIAQALNNLLGRMKRVDHIRGAGNDIRVDRQGVQGFNLRCWGGQTRNSCGC